jgi:hypothetical protein
MNITIFADVMPCNVVECYSVLEASEGSFRVDKLSMGKMIHIQGETVERTGF